MMGFAHADATMALGNRDRDLLMLMAYTGVRTVEVQKTRLGGTIHRDVPSSALSRSQQLFASATRPV